jgi:electron transfer flavoprotein beta subunit
MNIIVFVKQVPDINLPINIDYDNNTVDTEDLIYIINPCDMVAVEEAVRIREKRGRGKVTVVSLGTSDIEPNLKKCLALGADEAILIKNSLFDYLDPHGISYVLAKAIGSLEYELILCGNKAKDIELGGGQTGPRIAGLLGLPFVTNIDKLKISNDGKKLIVHKRLERGNKNIIECPLPALLTVNENLNTPRYPSFPSSLRSIKSEIKKIDADDIGVQADSLSPLVKVLNIIPPKARQRKIFTVDSSLHADDRVRLVLSGGDLRKKTTALLEGSPDKLKDDIIEFLIKNEIIKAEGE